MIQTLFRNSFSFNVLATGFTFLLTVLTTLMAGVIVLYCFPVIGEAIATWMGTSRFAAFIHLLY